MILPGGKYHIYLATRPVDFRKGHTGLSLVVQTILGRDPYSGAVFVFRSKRGDRIKILVWDQTGLVFGAALEPVARSPLTLQASRGRPVSLAQAGGWDDHADPGAIFRFVRGARLEGGAGRAAASAEACRIRISGRPS